jgi:hypothetical protein
MIIIRVCFLFSPAESFILPPDIFYGSEAPTGTRRITFSDGSFVYISDPSAIGVNAQSFQQSVYHFPQYQNNHQSSSSHGSRLPNPTGSSATAAGSTVIVTGGNGADAANGGADGVCYSSDIEIIFYQLIFYYSLLWYKHLVMDEPMF